MDSNREVEILSGLRTKAVLMVALMAGAAVLMSGCAGHGTRTEKPVVARCNEQPQWTTRDEAGRAVGIFVCFGERSQLLYAVRVLPPSAPAAAPAPAAAAPAADPAVAARKRRAQHRRQK